MRLKMRSADTAQPAFRSTQHQVRLVKSSEKAHSKNHKLDKDREDNGAAKVAAFPHCVDKYDSMITVFNLWQL